MGAGGMPVGTGRVVRSIAGRDAGVFYVVLEDRDGRVLLSSLPGVAVISVKIDGIQHEFSTIPGVKEDGKRRPLERPKCKSRRHIRKTNTVLELSGAATNKMLRRALRPFYENEGGEPLV